MNERIRHSIADRCMHWSNALLWLTLFFTGAALLQNQNLAPFGLEYPRFMRELAGGAGNLLRLHIILGFIWLGAFALYVLTNSKNVLFFLREIFSTRPGDLLWLRRKPLILLLGKKLAAQTGVNTNLPPQGFYNMGQKVFGMLSVVGGVVLAATGVIMAVGIGSTELSGWCVTAHYLACGLVFCGLLAHLYMTLAVPEERPGLKSMFNGSVTEEYAVRHHGLWTD